MTTLGGIIALPDGSTVKGKVSFNDRIERVDIDADASSSVGDDYILPGLIDLQVNGSDGIDVMSATPASLVELGRRLAGEGTTAWLPTAVTAPIEHIVRSHVAIDEATQASRTDASKSAAILGMHLEGPFISPLRLGAHPKLNLEPRGDSFERVLSMRSLKLITLAPEMPGAIDEIGRLVARKVVVSIGHTNATLEEANAGIAAGARMFTHLYNAMRPLNHRDPGVIASALAPSPAFAAVIPDGVHVHPEMLRLAWRARGTGGTIIVSDRVLLANTVASDRENVGRGRASIRDRAVRLTDGTLAGSIISMLDGVRLMIEKVGVSVGDASVMAATNPATLIGANDRGRIQADARADLIVLDRTLELKTVYIGGRELA
jgi:N-acetylglucosamine-6-phosphate deacetylase